jgi:prepilin signal peptidase PulO-like enzyme (type II secretory pathway)
VTPLHLITAGVLAVTLTIASVLDIRYREVPRSVWLGAVLVAVPLGLYQWLGTYQADPSLATLNLLVVGLVVIGSWFANEFRRLNAGDCIGLSMVFISLSYGVYPLLTLFFAGLWGMVVAGVLMIRHRSLRVDDIPFLVPLTLGLLSALVFWQ